MRSFENVAFLATKIERDTFIMSKEHIQIDIFRISAYTSIVLRQSSRKVVTQNYRALNGSQLL